ncbi:MAG TPA: phosphomannomutase/phosphoglucomutase [Acidimicrobiales bacterium]|nr:phosphomannomutase/phosphoglucomutase [Acidimicrobiales bacterium]
MSSLDDVFKAYDIRGLVPEDLNAELARQVGAAFARFAQAETVLVGRDMRPSGLELSGAFIDGVLAQGVNVVDLGLIPTDLLYFASGHLNLPGVTFTGSHNPAQYNGIKLCLAGAKPVGEDTGLRDIRADVEAKTPDAAGARRGESHVLDLLPDYAAHVHSFVDVNAIRPLKVVADTANGMGGLAVPEVMRGLGVEIDILFGELDGTFPNHPADPINPANQVDLIARVRATGADVGLAFDGDADRVFLVDEQGVGLSGSTTTAMLAAMLLDRNPGATVIYNLICSRAVPEVIREHGGTPVMERVGHSFIKARMAQTNAIFGGEHSAHYYFRDNYFADSGLIAAVMILELISRAQQPLSELRKPFERYAASGEINTRVADPKASIEKVAQRFSYLSQDRLDGLTVNSDSWWFNVRPSNTEPLLRLNLEAATKEDCEARTQEVLAIVREG